jgi:DNA-binding SARP family transcriptional activator
VRYLRSGAMPVSDEGNSVDFRVLGALEAVSGGRALELGGVRQRAVLAYLVLHAGVVVPADRLIDEVWSGNPPDTAANTLQVYVSKLRKALHAADGTDVLRTRRPGYVLAIEPEQVDSVRFERLLELGRSQLASGDAESAAGALTEALALWRGSALADLSIEPFVEPFAARLDELRVVAREERIAADLELGRHADVVPELERLIREHPSREGPRGQLMLALYRSGRQADALQAYQDARAMLLDELGLDPSPSLQQLEKAILRHDPSVQAPPTRARSPVALTPAESREVRKTVTVLTAEVACVPVGRDSLDPEALKAVTERCIGAITESLEHHGGTVQQLAPEAIRALFGVPSLHEDDPLRALRAARELSAAVEALSDEVAGWHATASVRGGVATGEVVVVEPLRPGADPTGEALDLARRLQNAARPGEMLVAEATRELTAEAAQTEAADPVPLPGRADPAPAWRLVDVVAGAEQIARRRYAQLVGRQLELAQIRQSFDRTVRERRCTLFTVLGPAGIGKSRLADELGSDVADAAVVLTGRCLSYGEGITFWPIAEIVKQAVGENVRAGLEEVLGNDADAQLIAERVAGAIGAGEAGGGGEETFWAVRKLLEALSRTQPLIVVLDDVHWAEPTLLDLVDHVVDWARDAPILLVCLSRPDLLDLRPTWAGGKVNAASIMLEPLTEGECDLLIENLLGAGDLPEEARLRIAEAAEGNPLFVEQTLSMLVEDGVLRRRRGRWELATEVPEAVVPPTIQALMAARLDRLDRPDRRTVDHASVVGRVFWPSAVAALAGSATETAATVLPRLRGLVHRELFAPDASVLGGEEGYRFRHVLIREAAYHAIPKRERALLHERVGGWLERVAEERVREYEELIGYHLEQAHRYLGEIGPLDERGRRLGVQAGERLAAAGARALKRGDVPAAVSLLARAAALLPEEHRHRSPVLLRLAEALRERGDFDWASSVLDELLEVARATRSRSLAAHTRVVRLRMELVRDPTLSPDRLLGEAEEVADEFGELADDEGLAKAWFILAWIPWVRGQAAATEAALERAIEHGRKAPDERAYWQALHLSAGAALFGPLPVPEAVRRCEELISAGESLRVESSAVRALAVLRAMEGNAEEARGLVARDRELLRDLGLRFLAAAAAEAYGMVELLLGDAEAAAAELRQGYDELEAMAARPTLSTIAAVLAQAEFACGRHDESVRLTEVSERATSEEDLSTQIQWRGPRAKVLAERGEADEAERLAREAVALAESTDFLSMQADALADLAEVLRLIGRGDEAVPVLRSALKLYKRKGNKVSAARVAGVVKSLPVRR